MTRRYLLESNAMSDSLNKRRGVDVKVQEARQRGMVIGTCEPVVGELYYGAEKSATRDANLRQLRVGLLGVKVWPFDRAAAEEFGRLRAELRRIGRTMGIVDVQLAAVALTLGNCTVVSTDSDLSAVPGLAVENWVT
ncbi:MAG TPA: type II toxin-antitoxin system VapC family toxin [Fimbriiglobus sp.]|nr:type II toxin-antitoxin system VapC family toxin [Fimbriiglobus sp.]